MNISQQCPQCGKGLTVPDAYIGRQIKCSGCEFMFEAVKPAIQTRPTRLPWILLAVITAVNLAAVAVSIATVSKAKSSTGLEVSEEKKQPTTTSKMAGRTAGTKEMRPERSIAEYATRDDLKRVYWELSQHARNLYGGCFRNGDVIDAHSRHISRIYQGETGRRPLKFGSGSDLSSKRKALDWVDKAETLSDISLPEENPRLP